MIPEKKNKIFKIILSAIWWTATIILAVILVTIFGAKMQGKVPRLFGNSVMHIVTGSMEPELMVGDYILIRDCAPEDIKKGDIISFYSEDPAIYGLPNTHRVAEDPIITENGIEFVTRGDANAANDSYRVKEDALIGKYVCVLTGLNAIARLVDGNAVFIILIVLQTAILAIFIFSLFRKGDDEDGRAISEITKEEEEKLKSEAIAEYLASQEKDNKN